MIDGIVGKLERAEKHLKLATKLLRRFARHEGEIVRKHDPESGWVYVYAKFPDLPSRIGLVIGDAIHNMRAALDYSVYALVLSNPNRPDGVPNDKTMFPISDTREGFRRQVDKLGRLTGVANEPLAIIDGVQPYHARESGLNHRANVLWILNKLENIDKHRRIGMLAGVAARQRLEFTLPDGQTISHSVIAGQRVVDEGTILVTYRAPAPGEPEMEVKTHITATAIVFDEPGSEIVNLEVEPALWQILLAIRKHVIVKLAPYIHDTPQQRGASSP